MSDDVFYRLEANEYWTRRMALRVAKARRLALETDSTNGDRQEDVEDGKPLSDGRAFYVEDGH